MPDDEAVALLDELKAHATQPGISFIGSSTASAIW